MRAEAPWLEDVPAGWASVPLRYLADVETGSADTQDADPDGEYPFVVRSPRFLAIDHFTHDREAILTPGDGDVGRVFHHLNGKFAVHQRVYVLSNFKGVTGRFAYYAFSSTFRYVTDSGTAKSTVESLRRPMLTSFPLPVPPAHTQGVITDFLDRETAKIDALIAKQRELTKTALEHRDRLILDLITRGKGREPLVDSGVDWIGAMPQHWKTRPLRYVLASVETGVWGSDPTVDGGGTHCVRVADFDREQLLVTDPVPTLREVSPEDVRRRGLRRADLLIERSGGTQANPVGFVVSFESDVEAVCSNFISRMRLGDGMNPRYWLYAFYAARLTRITEKWTKQTTGIQNLDFGGFSSEYFPCPPAHEQDQIARDLDQLMSATQAQLRRLRSLEALLTERRAALITAAVTGTLDVTTYGKAG